MFAGRAAIAAPAIVALCRECPCAAHTRHDTLTPTHHLNTAIAVGVMAEQSVVARKVGGTWEHISRLIDLTMIEPEA